MRFSATCYGLNHLSFYRDFTVDGQDVSTRVLANTALFKETEMKLFDEGTISLSDNELPNEYLYFYLNNKDIQALMIHPLINDYAIATKILVELQAAKQKDFIQAQDLFKQSENVLKESQFFTEYGPLLQLPFTCGPLSVYCAITINYHHTQRINAPLCTLLLVR